MKLRALVIVPAGVLLAARLSAQPPANPSFRFERPIVAPADGAHRLAIDVPLLAGAEARDVRDLRDFRIYDPNGREVGYLLVGNPPQEPTFTTAAILPVAPVETRTSKSSGFEADLGDALVVDRFRVDGLPAPFLKRVRLEGSGDREHWTLLVAEGTLFDLPADRLLQTELRFRAGRYRYLRLTWDDTNSGRLPHPAAASAGRPGPIAPPPPLTTPLTFERRSGEPGRSFFRIRLPGGHMPIAALDLDVGGGHVMREAIVYEARLLGGELSPSALGRATLRRVVASGVAASALRIDIQRPSDSQLDLVLDDGDNPPIDLRGVTAVFAELPWIYFESPAGALTARYGNTTLAPPRYDIEAVRENLKIDTIPDASWGEARARSADDNPAPDAALPTVGAPVDTGQFRYVRIIPAGSAGLVAVGLDAHVLAHSAGVNRSFADVRVIDDQNRQVPYVLERTSEPISMYVVVERLPQRPAVMGADPSQQARQSVYRIALPDDNLPALRIVLTTSARVFDRRISFGVERAADQRRRDPWLETVATAAWRHADQDRPAPALTVSIPAARTATLLMVVNEGDNAPLPIDAAQLLLPAYRVRLFRDATSSLRLAYGSSDLARPQYDLALLAPKVLATPATDVAPSAERAALEPKPESVLLSPRVFWVFLGVAALVLVGLIARLLRKA